MQPRVRVAAFPSRRGKLSLDLQYRIINSQLLGENKVLLEQFTLGERVESPTAINNYKETRRLKT